MDDVVLLLANSAESGATGLIHALGLGWSVTNSPTPPMALVLLVKVPWDQTNAPHQLVIKLVDSDGNDVLLGQDQLGNPAPLMLGMQFETGRPPGVVPGTPIDFQNAVNIGAGIMLTPGQSYQWRVEIDGQPTATRSFYVRPAGG